MKFCNPPYGREIGKSPSMRREWIEMKEPLSENELLTLSPSMRREWIEIIVSIGDTAPVSSPSMRREWIEIPTHRRGWNSHGSPSMRREWIEMNCRFQLQTDFLVSLHAEGVD